MNRRRLVVMFVGALVVVSVGASARQSTKLGVRIVPAAVYSGDNFGCETVGQPAADGKISCRVVIKVDGKWVEPKLVGQAK
jgi:hypothetical protein